MLSLRLKAVASYINRNDHVADIGCDHGLLGIHLVKSKKVKEIIVSDILPSALNNARENILKEDLVSFVYPKVGDGLEVIENDTNTITISGMGTHTILKILDNQKINQIDKMVICSNMDYNLLRKNIVKKGFFIADEKVVFEKDNYYVVILFKRGHKKYSLKEIIYGPILITKKSSKKYFEYLIQLYEKLITLIPKKKIIKIIGLKYNLCLVNNIIKSLN